MDVNLLMNWIKGDSLGRCDRGEMVAIIEESYSKSDLI